MALRPKTSDAPIATPATTDGASSAKASPSTTEPKLTNKPGKLRGPITKDCTAKQPLSVRPLYDIAPTVKPKLTAAIPPSTEHPQKPPTGAKASAPANPSTSSSHSSHPFAKMLVTMDIPSTNGSSAANAPATTTTSKTSRTETHEASITREKPKKEKSKSSADSKTAAAVVDLTSSAPQVFSSGSSTPILAKKTSKTIVLKSKEKEQGNPSKTTKAVTERSSIKPPSPSVGNFIKSVKSKDNTAEAASTIDLTRPPKGGWESDFPSWLTVIGTASPPIEAAPARCQWPNTYIKSSFFKLMVEQPAKPASGPKKQPKYGPHAFDAL